MDKLKVLHVSGSISVGSGVSSIIMNYHRHIDKSKIHFDFIVHNDLSSEYHSEITEAGGTVYRLPKLALENVISLHRAIEELLVNRQGEYNVIHIHTPNLCSIYFSIAKRMGIKHRVSHSHNTKYSDSFWRAIRNYLLTRQLRHYSTSLVACSEVAGEFLYGKKLVQNGDVLILNNGIDCSRYRFSEKTRNKLRNEYGLGDKFIIGHVGRFDEQKNHTFLVDVFHQVYLKNKQAVLLLIGEGKLQREIKNKVDKLGLSSAIFFMGKRNNIHELVQMMDVFLLPSLYEGLPVVGIEAQASGLPCVFSTTISNEVQVLKSVKFISLEESPVFWSQEILDLMSYSVRKDTYGQMVNAGYDVVSSVHLLEDFYFKLCSGGR